MFTVEITIGGRTREPVEAETPLAARAVIAGAIEAYAATLDDNGREALYVGTVHAVNQLTLPVPGAEPEGWSYEDGDVSIRVTRAT